MYRSASKPVRGLSAIGRYHAFSPVPSYTGLYCAMMVEISTITARYRLVVVDFDRHRPLPSGISLVAAREEEARERGRRRGRTSDIGEPRDGAADEENLVRQRVLHRGPLLVALSSSEATRKRGKRQ
ncbi:hypothetical protein BHE74_00025979 [Ensete ventricosum]|nr:hypothetical protein BHE74_00025979 [Ensete ventricosum]